ncbi:MAG: rRNA maturation RNase YbeY [Gemmatimonadales bacterium]
MRKTRGASQGPARRLGGSAARRRTRTVPPSRRPAVEPPVSVSGRHGPLTRAQVVAAARTVLRAEARRADLAIAFVGRDRMRALNRQWKGQDRVTDVLAFPLPDPRGTLVGDIYICPWQAAQEATVRRIPLGEELTRLIVHGVLHVLGRKHPEGNGRTRSPMWERQEHLVRRLR